MGRQITKDKFHNDKEETKKNRKLEMDNCNDDITKLSITVEKE